MEEGRLVTVTAPAAAPVVEDGDYPCLPVPVSFPSRFDPLAKGALERVDLYGSKDHLRWNESVIVAKAARGENRDCTHARPVANSHTPGGAIPQCRRGLQQQDPRGDL